MEAIFIGSHLALPNLSFMHDLQRRQMAFYLVKAPGLNARNLFLLPVVILFVCFVSSFSSPSFDSSLTACVLLQGTSTLTWRFSINLIVSPQRDLSIHALFRATHTGLCTRVTIGILLICVELKRKALNTCHDYNSWEKVGGRENMVLFVLSAIAQCPA